MFKNLEMKYSQNVSGLIVQDENITLIHPPICDIKTISAEAIQKRRAPYVQAISNVNSAASVFKLARLCYEKSLSYFIMDGRVTEHVNVQQEISKLPYPSLRIKYKLIAMPKQKPMPWTQSLMLQTNRDKVEIGILTQ